MDERSPLRRQIFIEGYVQGVGYRSFVRSWAIRLKVSGWVRNRTDGAVEALVQGAEADLERFRCFPIQEGFPRGSGRAILFS